MILINGVLNLKIDRKYYNLNEETEIIYDKGEYSCINLYKKIIIPKTTMNKILRNEWIYYKETNLQEGYIKFKIKQDSNNYIRIGQELYYRGLNWGSKCYCYHKEIIDNKVYVLTNNGVKRLEEEVLSNSCDLYTNKEMINKTLVGIYMGEFVK